MIASIANRHHPLHLLCVKFEIIFNEYFMNKNVVGVIILVLVLLTLGAFLYYRPAQPVTPPTSTSQNPSETAPGGNNSTSASLSFKDLLAAGTPVSCTFGQTVEGRSTSGTVYVASGKMRGDFQSQTADGKQNVTGHMITLDQTSYIWTNQSNTGFKVSLNNTSQIPNSQKAQGFDPDKKNDVTCNPWTVDQSQFTLPNITFQDFSAVTGGTGSTSGSAGAGAGGSVTPGIGSLKTVQCSTCDQIQDAAAKAACNAEYHCSGSTGSGTPNTY